jgi:putative endonuclease
MAGLDPAICPRRMLGTMQGGWVYILTNKPHGVLYTGVTAQLRQRIWQHRQGTGGDFTARYRLTRLVHAEPHATILAAIQREKAIKHWSRAWKLALIEQANPGWDDLFNHLAME